MAKDPFCVNVLPMSAWVSAGSSDFIPQFKDIHVRWIEEAPSCEPGWAQIIREAAQTSFFNQEMLFNQVTVMTLYESDKK